MEPKRDLTSAPAQTVPGWRRISDAEWINIVNAPAVLSAGDEGDCDIAVNKAVALTEARCRALNEPLMAALVEALEGMLSIEDSVTQGQEAERRAKWRPLARAALALARGEE